MTIGSKGGAWSLLLCQFLLSFLPLQASAQWEERHSQGCRRGTPPPADVQAKSRRALSSAASDGLYMGERRQLTVLAAFADRPFSGSEEQTLEQWDKIFNAPELAEAPFRGSVHDYFYDQSYGQLSLVFDLQYVALGSGHAKYGSTSSDDENSQYLVDDVVEQLRQRDIDWSQYDWDGDGMIEQLLIVFAGKGSSYGGFGGDKGSIWPHQWWLSWHLDLSTADAYDYRTPLTVTSDGKDYLVDSYCALQELSRSGDYSVFGTICHEYSHCFGLPDFYNGNTSYLSSWDLMDSGNSNGSGYCPAGYSAHERMLMGWLTPTELTGATRVSGMAALADEPQAYLIRNDAWHDEYYIVENRQQQGWDAALPGSGIVVFHVDYDPDVWISLTQIPNTAAKKRYSIFAANNLQQTFVSYLSGWPYPSGGNDELTDTSQPRAVLNNPGPDGTRLMGKPLTAMSVGDGLASFVFGDPASSVDAGRVATSDGSKLLYRYGPLTIVRRPDGTVHKVMGGR